MDIYDKLIIVCIIFTILAILSIVFGCHYLTKKTEGFTGGLNLDIKKKLKELTELFKNGTEDFEILEYMRNNKELFKNEKFINKVVEALENAEKPKENFKKSKQKIK